MGFMALEGVHFPRDVHRARSYFTPSPTAFHNTTLHRFGRALLAFYGLGEERNETKACAMIDDCVTDSQAAGPLHYYAGLCALRRYQWERASQQLEVASFQRFAPATELVSTVSFFYRSWRDSRASTSDRA